METQAQDKTARPMVGRTHHYPASGFSIRLMGRGERPLVRFADTRWRVEEWSRGDAARLIRSARRRVRDSWRGWEMES